MVLDNIENIVKYAMQEKKSIEIELTDTDKIAFWTHLISWAKGYRGYFVHETYYVNGEIVLVTGENDIIASGNYKDKLTNLCIKIGSAWEDYVREGGKLTISNSFEGKHKYQFNDILETYFRNALRTAFSDVELLLVPRE